MTLAARNIWPFGIAKSRGCIWDRFCSSNGIVPYGAERERERELDPVPKPLQYTNPIKLTLMEFSFKVNYVSNYVSTYKFEPRTKSSLPKTLCIASTGIRLHMSYATFRRPTYVSLSTFVLRLVFASLATAAAVDSSSLHLPFRNACVYHAIQRTMTHFQFRGCENRFSRC